MQNRKYKLKNNNPPPKIPEVYSVSLRDFNLSQDLDWLVDLIQSDHKMSQESQAQNWIQEFLHPQTIESFLQDPCETIMKIISEHIQRQSLPKVIESSDKMVGMIFVSKPQTGVFLLEKFYLNYVMLLYKKETLVSQMLLDFIRQDEAYRQKLKGLFSKLKTILWSFRYYLESIETSVQRDSGFTLIRNQSKCGGIGIYRVYKFVISNPMVNQRIELFKEEQELLDKKLHDGHHHYNERPVKKKIVMLKEDLEQKMNELKKSYSPKRARHNHQNNHNRSDNKSVNKSNTSINKAPSLPNLQTHRNSAALNNNHQNQSFQSIQTTKSIGFNKQLFKVWNFVPSIQERFKISLSTHKDKFDLLQKQKQMLISDTSNQFYNSLVALNTKILDSNSEDIINEQSSIKIIFAELIYLDKQKQWNGLVVSLAVNDGDVSLTLQLQIKSTRQNTFSLILKTLIQVAFPASFLNSRTRSTQQNEDEAITLKESQQAQLDSKWDQHHQLRYIKQIKSIQECK
ncbi:UNKNOWN [Stylonychia lemnae]|uniref:Uncharacterized protein n=1 Tax=Stylonychia lemnae TaxID=5949 RepID=A0A078A347_STYLE|nr:UNKNOWN [Stylonychia lemnae]|eukprot:CDW75923.1 UNKNOWN [Stylonychia lemnae]